MPEGRHSKVATPGAGVSRRKPPNHGTAHRGAVTIGKLGRLRRRRLPCGRTVAPMACARKNAAFPMQARARSPPDAGMRVPDPHACPVAGVVRRDPRRVGPGRAGLTSQPPWNFITRGTISSATMLMILISGLTAGPAVSL